MKRDLSYGERVAKELAIKRTLAPKQTSSTKQRRSRKTPTLETYPMRNYVYKHTQDGINWLDTSLGDGLAERVLTSDTKLQMLVLGTGSGKTAIALNAVARIGEPFMVVAPPSVVRGGGWQETISSFNQAHPESKLDPYTITTFEKFANVLADTKARAQFKRDFPQNGIIILDEVHNYKNPTSKRSLKLRNIPNHRKIGLSATILTNDMISDMCSYTIMAGIYSSKTDFIKRSGLTPFIDRFHRLCVYDRDGRVDVNIWPYYYTLRKQMGQIVYRPPYHVDDSQFPDVNTIVIPVPSDPTLNSDLRSIMQSYKDRHFDSIIDATNAMMTRVVRSEQRLEVLKEILDSGAKQPLVFYQHEATLKTLREWFPLAQILNGENHIDAIDRNDLERPIFIQYQAGSEGVEFPNSDTSVFYENQYSYVCLVQARGRNVRRGHTHEVNHYMLVSDAPFEQAVYDRVAQKVELNPEEIEEIVNSIATSDVTW